MKREIKLKNNIIIKLPKGMTSEMNTDWFGWTVYFGGFHIYISEDSIVNEATEKIKDLALKVFKDPKKVIDWFLLKSN